MTAGMVIVGAGMAGHRAVIGLRAGGYEGPITLVGEETLMPYDRPPLSKAAITSDEAPVPVWLMDDSIAASLKVTLRLDEQALSIDRQAKFVACSHGRIHYDKLLIATGAKPRQLTLPGGKHALLLRNFSDAEDIRAKFKAGKKITIIGGGFIGLELASSASKRGCDVTVVEAQPRILMRGVPEEIANIVHQRHIAAGVRMLTGVGITSISGHAVLLADGTEIAADTIIAGIGAAPDIKLAADAGLALDNGIAVDATLQTSDPDIYAAGDCCSFPHPVFGNRRIRLEAWRNAQDQGMLAGENMAGANKEYRAVPWFWSDQYDLSLQIAGMPDMGPVMVKREAAPGTIILFHLSADGKLMGASGIGPGNAIARDIKLAEMLITKGANPDPAALADPAVQLKSLLRS
jgi:3-phenylpropionate/trans-cinnamate dioxygenase ferredoxin reductase subunit